MLLGKKTRYIVGSDWAVILDRSTNEFAKNRAIDKLSQAFNLSLEEAKDLAENTPIILLDQLPLDLAEKIKDFFAQSNIDCSLTNDTFTKRKCFRAIWPGQPDLGRLIGEAVEANESEIYVPISKGIEEELQDLTLDLQKENQLLQSELEKTEVTHPAEEESKEVRRHENAPKLERIHLEEEVNRLKSENQASVRKISELESNLKNVSQANDKEVKSQFTELRAQLSHYRGEYTRIQNAAKQAQAEAKQFQNDLTLTQKSLSQTRAEMEDLKRMLSQMQSNSVQLKEETEQIRREAENRIHHQTAELEEWKRKANDWSGNYFKVIKENEFLRGHQSEELEAVKIRNQQLSTQLEQAQRQIREFVAQLEQQELIQKRMKAASEMAEQEAQLKILVYQQRTLEDEIRIREEEMKKVLLDQEAVEQAVMNAKQAQKYLLEQSKIKEKGRGVRPKIINPSVPQEPGTQSSLPEPGSELND